MNKKTQLKLQTIKYDSYNLPIFEVLQFAKQIPENQFLQKNIPVTIILQETSFN